MRKHRKDITAATFYLAKNIIIKTTFVLSSKQSRMTNRVSYKWEAKADASVGPSS